jgi:hypothetical protein
VEPSALLQNAIAVNVKVESDHMKVYDIRDAQGRLTAFEVDGGIGRRGLCRAVASIPNVKVLRTPKLMSWLRESEFCEFEYLGSTYVAEEPFGDNSRYWIGSKPPRFTEQLASLYDAFRGY